MKKILFIILASVLFGSSAFADAIYLKDGSIVRGAITGEDEKTIFVEIADTWKQIDRSTIERIIKDDKSSLRSIPPSDLQPMPPVDNIVVQTYPPQQPTGNTSTTNVDVRMKFGNAAGADKIEFTPGGDMESDTDRHGGNVQVEVAISPIQGSMAGPVFTVGVFGRQHSGKIIERTRTTTMKYDASGVSLAGGLRLKASERFHFEIKVEVGVGQGGVKLESPNYAWNKTRDSTYSSVATIAGWYYAFSKPGLQLGLEIGAQSFTGEFDIWNTAGHWDSGKITGSSGIANLALGFHF